MSRKTVRFGGSVALGILAFGGVPWPSTAAANEWKQIGNGIHATKEQRANEDHHQSGRLVQVSRAYDYTQSRHVLWALASEGGLWKEIVDGSGKPVSWVPLSDNLGAKTLGSFAILDADNFVVGSGSIGWGSNGDGIYYTTTGGATWQHAKEPSAPAHVTRIVADYSDSTGRTLVAASSDGIWRSTNFGKKWSPWLSGVEATDVVQDVRDASRWYAGVVGQRIYVYEGVANGWEPYGTGIEGSIARVSLAACNSDFHYLYALVLTTDQKINGVYRSQDRGMTWVSIYSNDAQINPDSQGTHVSAIACDPADPAHIFFGMVKSLQSTNATAHPAWDVKAHVFDGGHADYNFMLFSNDGATLHIGNDGGYYSYDITNDTVDDSGNLLGLNNLQLGGAKTESYSSLQGGLSSSYSNPDVFFAGLQDNGVVRGDVSADPAITLVVEGDGRHVSVRPDNPLDMGFNSNGSSTRNLSYDGGKSHTGIDFDLSPEKSAAVLIDPTPGRASPLVFTADQAFGLFSGVYYNDFLTPASPWRPVSLLPILVPGVISNVDATIDPDQIEIVATVAGDTGVYAFLGPRSLLGVLLLGDISPPRPANPVDKDARINADRSTRRRTTLYYTSGDGHYNVDGAEVRLAYVSHDGGSSWTEVTGDIATVSDNANLVKLIGNPGDKSEFFLATNKGVFRGDRGKDGKVHWKDYSNGLRYHEKVDDIVINFDNVSGNPTLYIATRGRGFWRRTIE